MTILEVSTQPTSEKAALSPSSSGFVWKARETMASTATNDKAPVLVAEIEILGEEAKAYTEPKWQEKFLELWVDTENYKQFL